ncbi:MAG: glycine betaine ABC transporter substrate-binding protein, partial [Propionibacteriaceae bacterium]
MTRHTRMLLALLAALCLAVSVAACGSDDSDSGSGDSGGGDAAGKEIKSDSANSKTTITVGSKNFPEQFILGEIYSQALEAAGYTVKKDLNLGSEVVAFKALKQGKIDAYPEYTGTALTALLGKKVADVPKEPQAAYDEVVAGAKKDKITAYPPTPFENTFRLGLLKEKATELKAKKSSDLDGKTGDLKITGYPECRQRADCLIGVEKAYGKFGKFVGSEQTYQVIDNKDADVGFLFTTDAQLSTGKYTTLDDDKKVFPPYNITLLMRDQQADALGEKGKQLIVDVQKPLTEKVMVELNSRVVLDKQKPA